MPLAVRVVRDRLWTGLRPKSKKQNLLAVSAALWQATEKKGRYVALEHPARAEVKNLVSEVELSGRRMRRGRAQP